ncbi:MAG TPA: winged helix-turn-helix domain-containing protein [Pyrinomonadaceae bacterium]|jgi:DNA-binding winged helix-turn-helix (wHTH) protein
MKNLPDKIYNFDKFQFDAVKLALYHDDRMIKNIGEKPLRVLAVLLKNQKKLTAHDEIIEQVWADNPLGINSVHIAQYISKLRKVFAEYAPGKEYIETVKGRGYSFVGDVSANEYDDLTPLEYEPSEYLPASPEAENGSSQEIVSPRSLPKAALVFAALISVCLAGFLAWTWFSETDEQEIRRIVEESQKYESMVLYSAPASVKEEQLNQYWLTDSDFNSELDVKKVRAGVERLIREGKYYGNETKAEQFEIQEIEINDARDFATIKTLEKWFIAEYLSDGTLFRNKTVGPYFVTYSLQKKDGRWLIEKSNTARAKPKPDANPIK